jgi:hypothetical protein
MALAASAALAANPWSVSTSTAPSTGVVTTMLQNAGTTPGEGSLVVFCTSAGTRGYYLATQLAPANGSVRYRVGPNALVTETWSASTIGGQTALVPPGSDLSFLRQVYLNWDVVIQYNAVALGSRTLQINASGFSEVLDQTRAACGWPTDLLPADNGWGKDLPAAPPPDALEGSYGTGVPNQFRLIAWRAHSADGKTQLLVRLGDKGGPCTGPLPITDHRLYVTQGDRMVSAVAGENFEIGCLTSPTIFALNGDYDAGKAFTLTAHAFHASATGSGPPFTSIAFDGAVAPLTPVIEYYNASFDHYFITWVPAEIAILDAGTAIKGWVRTGRSFPTYTTALSGTSPVCRYYIPPKSGDSHFFGRDPDECFFTASKNPSFILEDPAFMQMYLPLLGVCPAFTTEVYRVFSNRPDANHRYMTDRALRDQMVAKGWKAEGDGPNLVTMCAPQ